MACEQGTVTTIRKYVSANLALCSRRDGEPVTAEENGSSGRTLRRIPFLLSIHHFSL